MSAYLTARFDVNELVLRTAPGNTASQAVACRARFTYVGDVVSPDGDLLRHYVQPVRQGR
jgi:RimJ/RimL family protein N-acetyltransferase